MKKVVYVVIFLAPSFLCAMDSKPSHTVNRLIKDDNRGVRFLNSDAFEVGSDSVQKLPSKRSSPTIKRVQEQSRFDYTGQRRTKLIPDETIGIKK